jgi:hypothetical protein
MKFYCYLTKLGTADKSNSLYPKPRIRQESPNTLRKVRHGPPPFPSVCFHHLCPIREQTISSWVLKRIPGYCQLSKEWYLPWSQHPWNKAHLLCNETGSKAHSLSWKCQHFWCLQKVNFEDLCCPDVSAWHGQHVADIATFGVFFTSYVVLCDVDCWHVSKYCIIQTFEFPCREKTQQQPDTNTESGNNKMIICSDGETTTRRRSSLQVPIKRVSIIGMYKWLHSTQLIYWEKG